MSLKPGTKISILIYVFGVLTVLFYCYVLLYGWRPDVEVIDCGGATGTIRIEIQIAAGGHEHPYTLRCPDKTVQRHTSVVANTPYRAIPLTKDPKGN